MGMKYNILKSNLFPAFDKYGNRELADGKNAYRVKWEIVGKCNSMNHAKQLGFTWTALELINKESS